MSTFMISGTKSITLRHCKPLIRVLKKCCVKRSSIPGAGKGLFVAEPCKRGDFITEYGGRVLNRSQCEQLMLNKSDTHLRATVLGREALDGRQNGYLTLDEYYLPHHLLGSFANDPYGSDMHKNAEYWTYDHEGMIHPCGDIASARVFLRALTDIPAGAEVFVSYGSDYIARNF